MSINRILLIVGVFIACKGAFSGEKADLYMRLYQEANQLESKINYLINDAQNKKDQNCPECIKRYNKMESDWKAMQSRIQAQIFAGYNTSNPQESGINTYKKACSEMRQFYNERSLLTTQPSGTLCGQPKIMKSNTTLKQDIELGIEELTSNSDDSHDGLLSDKIVSNVEECKKRIDSALDTLPGKFAKEVNKTISTIGNISTAADIIEEISRSQADGKLTVGIVAGIYKSHGFDLTPNMRAGMDSALKNATKDGTIEFMLDQDPKLRAEYEKLNRGEDSDDPLARMLYIEKKN